MSSIRGRGKIRPPRRTIGHGEDVDFDAVWASLSSALHEIHTKNASKLAFEVLYRAAYSLVLKKRGELLYDKVRAFEQEWLAGSVRLRVQAEINTKLINDTHAQSTGTVSERKVAGERLMRQLKEVWEDHIISMNMFSDVLMYLDRIYCSDQRKPNVMNLGMAQFRDYVVCWRSFESDSVPLSNNPRIFQVLIDIVLDHIEMEREGDLIDNQLIRSCMYMLEGLHLSEEDDTTKLYITEFERTFLSKSRDFYEAEGKRLLSEADAASFCTQAKKRLAEEDKRCKSTLSPLTAEKIQSVVESALIKNNITEVIALENSGVRHMLDNDRIEELRMVYDLVARVDPKKTPLQAAVQKRIVELGSAINTAVVNAALGASTQVGEANGEKAEGDNKTGAQKSVNLQTSAAIKWVDDILDLKQKCDYFLNKAFSSDPGLQAAFMQSFTEFINAFDRSSEYLSLFFDENMKKGIKGKSETEVDGLIDRGISLLRYIKDKDLFERYYKKHLSKRLLMKRSISMDAERSMIGKLKLEVGHAFTHKMESMFTDMTVSGELTSKYKQHIQGLGEAEQRRTELDINILTSTMWPPLGTAIMEDGSRSSCIFPSHIEQIRSSFEKFYLSQHSGRQLQWQANCGTADIRAYFPKSKNANKMKDLNVSTYMMVILMLFNDPAGISYTTEELHTKTNIPMNELTRSLQSLSVAPKTRVLLKEPLSREVKLTDCFSINENFTSPFQRVKIGVITSGKVEDVEERKETEKKNNDARGAIIEAAVVRIMKSRKTLDHQKLMTEVIQQLSSRFAPDVQMVKKRIESLIEREYLERVEEKDPPAYRYLA